MRQVNTTPVGDYFWYFYSYLKKLATSKTRTRTLDPDLDPKKTWTLKNLDPEKHMDPENTE